MSSDIKIEISSKELERFSRDIKKYSETTQRKVQDEVQRTTLNIKHKAKQNASNDDLLGTRSAVVAGIHSQIQNRRFTGRVTSSHKAAAYIEQGTKPHKIRARNAKYLTFKVGTAGSLATGRFTKSQWVRVKEVNHPGTRPQPYMRPAADSEFPIFVKRIKAIL